MGPHGSEGCAGRKEAEGKAEGQSTGIGLDGPSPGSFRPRTGGPELDRMYSFLCPEAPSPSPSPSLCCPQPSVIRTALSGCLGNPIFRGEWPGLRFGGWGMKIKEAPPHPVALPMWADCERRPRPAPPPLLPIPGPLTAELSQQTTHRTQGQPAGQGWMDRRGWAGAGGQHAVGDRDLRATAASPLQQLPLTEEGPLYRVTGSRRNDPDTILCEVTASGC